MLRADFCSSGIQKSGQEIDITRSLWNAAKLCHGKPGRRRRTKRRRIRRRKKERKKERKKGLRG
jgi:ribosome-binding protein aMBF1 (putative translation factor)